MVFKLISLAFLFNGIVGIASAFTPLDPTAITLIESNQSPTKAEYAQDFTDFSGSWKGKCIIDNRETEEMVIIKNTATYIKFGNQHYMIGNSLHTESNASPQMTYVDHRQFEWSEEGHSLIMQGTKVLGDRLATFIFTDTMSLINDQLVISIKIKGFKNMELIQEATGSCVFNRA